MLVARLSALRAARATTGTSHHPCRVGIPVTAPELSALAESLITRYPQETEGYLYAGIEI
jgi:hypothetical protein